MDHFLEEVVKKRNRWLDEICYYLSWVLMVLSGMFALLELSGYIPALLSGQVQFSLFELIFILLSAGTAILLFLYHDRLRTEYEYTFTNGSLDFAQVFNNRKRKSLGSLNVRNVEAFGPVTGSAFQRYISMQNVKQNRWFLNRDGNLHFFYYQKDSVKHVIVLEPSEEMVSLIKQYLPRGVYQE